MDVVRYYLAVIMLTALCAGSLLAQELAPIYRAIKQKEYRAASEGILQYAQSYPDNTEIIDQLIFSLNVATKRHHNSLNALITSSEKSPAYLARVQNIMSVAEDRSARFGFNINAHTQTALDVFLATEEYEQLERALQGVGRHARAQKFVAAMQALKKTLLIGQERFLDTPQYQSVHGQMQDIVSELAENIDQFITLYEQEFVPIVRHTDTVFAALQESNFTSQEEDVERIISRINAVRSSLFRLNSRIASVDRDTDITYIEIIKRVGVVDYYTPYSIVGLIDGALQYEMDTVRRKYEQEFTMHLSSTVSAMRNFMIPRALSESSAAHMISESLLRISAFTLPSVNSITIPAINAVQDTDQQARLLEYFSYQTSAQLLEQIIGTFNASLQIYFEQDIDETLRQVIVALDASYVQHLDEWQLLREDILSLNSTVKSMIVDMVIAQIESETTHFVSMSSAQYTQIYSQYFSDTIAQYATLRSQSQDFIQESEELIYGAVRDTAVVENVDKYPLDALSILDDVATIVTEAIVELPKFQILLGSVDSANSALRAEFDSLLVDFVDIQNAVDALQSDAESNIATAQQLRESGDELRDDAVRALEQNDGRLAGDLWEQAHAKYLDSLALQMDDMLYQEVELFSNDIRERIIVIEHARVIMEVRILLNRSRRAIVIRDISAAYRITEEAAELWALTNIEPNPEIVQQQERIQLLQRFAQIYNLDINDPLYAVLSGYLNSAALNINSATALLNQGGVVADQQIIAETTILIQNVLDIRPFNTEARTLRLRLFEISDPDEFDRVLQDLYNSARQLATNSPSEALSDLYTIQALRPGYQNIEQEINDLEIRLGLRVQIVDTGDQDRAVELLSQAQSLIATGDSNRITAAENLLQQSISLDPDNNIAQDTLDQLRITRGSDVQTSLSLSDEQLLRRAETLFVQGNIAQTFVILENLWQDAVNRDYPPLVTLRQQVGSRLGI